MAAMKILVPYDGSKKSDLAFRYAIDFARRVSGRSEVILANVVEHIVFPPLMEKVRSSVSGKYIGPTELRKELYLSMKAGAKRMLSKKEAEASRSGVKTRVIVRYGYAADEIVRIAQEEKIDMIIIGNVGLHGISKLGVVGSVSRNVVERAPCPVMIVH